jgi:hypothetical protein
VLPPLLDLTFAVETVARNSKKRGGNRVQHQLELLNVDQIAAERGWKKERIQRCFHKGLLIAHDHGGVTGAAKLCARGCVSIRLGVYKELKLELRKPNLGQGRAADLLKPHCGHRDAKLVDRLKRGDDVETIVRELIAAIVS